MNKFLAISVVSMLAGMGQAVAQVSVKTDAISGIPAKCMVGGVATPSAGTQAQCQAVGGVYTGAIAPIPSQTAYVGPAGAKAITVTGDVTVTGKLNVNGVGDVNTALGGKADKSDLATTNTKVGGLNTWKSGLDGTAVGGSVTTTSAGGSSSTMDGNGFRFNDGHGGSVTIKDPTIIVTNGTDSTTIHDGDVTATGTVTAGAVIVNGRNVESSLNAHDAILANHNTRINSVQTQANATDHRLNVFNGSGGTIENWATGVNTDLGNIHSDIGVIDHHLGVVDSRLDALEGWEGVAKNQISDLYKRNNKAMEGVAMAMAMPSLTLEAGKNYGASANWANFTGNGAFGGAVAVRVSESWQLQGGVSIGSKEGQFGGRVGATWQH